MSSIVPYENDNPYRRPSLMESVAFWKYMFKKGLMSTILYFLSFVLLLILFTWLAQGLLSNIIGMSAQVIFVLALFTSAMLFFQIPSMPRLYKFQFKGKLRPDIPEEELKGLMMELTRKSLELASLVIIAMCILCAVVYVVAKYLALTDIIAFVLAVATAFNIFLIALVVVSAGGYNRDFMRRTFTEEEYNRYTSLGNYKRIFAALIIFDILAAILLVYDIKSKLAVGQTIILLAAILDNVLLALGLWNYRELKGKSENERKFQIPQMKRGLAVFIIVDLIFIASFIIQKIWTGISYERTVLALFTVFTLAAGILAFLFFLIALARRMLKSNIYR